MHLFTFAKKPPVHTGRLVALLALLITSWLFNPARAQSFTSAVATLSPGRNAVSVDKATDVKVTLDANWASGTQAASSVKVWSQQAGGRKAGTATVSGNALTFNPAADFKPGETVFATITTASGLAKAQVYQFTTKAAKAPGTFGSGSQLPMGNAPHGVAAADVDSDGDLDMLVANRNSNTVSVRLNDGTGNFSGTTNIGVGGGPASVAPADVDGDGDLDILTANKFSSTVSMRLNNGTGSFSGTTNIALGVSPYSITAADMDGDGDLDFLTANDDSDNVSVWLNNGLGTFSSTTNVAVGNSPVSIAAADVDSDGDLDILTANALNNNVSVRLNDGTGNFSGTTSISVGLSPYSVAVADVDGDGDLDFLAANAGSNTVSVRLNNGTGSFSGGSNVAVGSLPYSAVPADVDGDGDIDLLAANFDNANVSVRLNNGSGTFSGGSEVALGVSPSRVAAADVDGDGDLDFLTANFSSANVSVRLNQLEPAQPASVATLSPGRNAVSVDKATDVKVTLDANWASGTQAASSVKVWSQQAGGRKAGTATVSGNALTFNPAADFKPGETVFATITTASGLAKAQVYQFTTKAAQAPGTFSGGSEVTVGGSPQSVVAADVDGDGDSDLLTANGYNSTSVSVRLNNGSGSFSGGSEVAVGSGPDGVAAADVDGDGDLDILAANSRTNFVSVRLNNGSGSFSGGSNIGVGSGPQSIIAADVDGDGDLDFLTANSTSSSNSISVRLNNGTGSFGGGSNIAWEEGSPKSIAAADMDGDGDLDLLVADIHWINRVSVWLNDGIGQFSSHFEVPLGGSPQSVAAADVDSDGDLDILAANGSSVSVRKNEGDGSFHSGSNVDVANIPYRVAAADVDGDGDLDILAANWYTTSTSSSSSVSVRLNNGTGSFSGGADIPVGVHPSSVAAADVDGDGDLDFLTANDKSNDVSVRLNQFLLSLTAITKASELEDRSVTFTSAEFANAFSGGSLIKIKITALPASSAGVLQLNGTAVTADQEIVLADLENLAFLPAANYHGPASFSWNGSNGSSYAAGSAGVNITLLPVNDAPSFALAANPAAVNEDAGAQTIPGFATAPDDGDPEATQLLAFQVSNNTNPGLFAAAPVIAANGTLTYTPAANAHGSASITVSLTDDGGTANGGVNKSAHRTFTITVNPVSDAPVVANAISNVTAPEDGESTVLNLSNTFSDADGQPLTITLSGNSNPALVTATYNAETKELTLVYNLNASGTATITVKATDGTSETETAFLVTVNAANDAPVADAQEVTTQEDSPQTITLTGSDADGDALTYEIVTGPGKGSLSGTGAQRTYTPQANANGTDSFTFRVNDGSGFSAPATVTVNVTAVNDAPVAVNDAASTDEDTQLAGTTLLANDTDIDGNTLTATLGSGPAHGTLMLNSNGTYTYTPAANYSGSDLFTYRANDGTASSNLATVTITVIAVNQAPVANAQLVTTAEGVAKAITLAGSDVDGDALTYAIVTGPAHGTLSGTGASRTYTPAPNYHGPDSFTFTANDGSVTSAPATVTIAVTSVNNAPAVGTLAVGLSGATSTLIDPILVNSTIAASALLTDADFPNERVTIQWSWDDGSVEPSYSVTSGGNITNTHTYTSAGVYTVRVEVTDQASATTSTSFQYVVVYNPNGGFVTGAGWINSPAGAYVANPGASGRAHFGFVSRYQRGTTVPAGMTDFEFRTVDMNFTSTSYEWLVVAGAKAQYKGVGTINGSGNYGFLLSAVDGQVTGGGGVDKVRIKIWDKTKGDALVYDNQQGSTDDATATTAIGAGAIVVHDGRNRARQSMEARPETSLTGATLRSFPNPFSGRTTIEFVLDQNEAYSLEVYDLKGMLVKRLMSGEAEAGKVNQLVWQVGQSPIGLYFARLTTRSGMQHIKLVLK